MLLVVRVEALLVQVKPIGFYVPTELGIELVAVAVIVLDESVSLDVPITYLEALARVLHTSAVEVVEGQAALLAPAGSA